jgi:hypothetical protein
MHIELARTTQTLLDEIACKTMHQRDIAKTYALALRSGEETDWRAVNAAITERWSKSGLE